MEFKEFMKNYDDFCGWYNDRMLPCPMYEQRMDCNECMTFIFEEYDLAEEIMQKWIEEKDALTFRDIFDRFAKIAPNISALSFHEREADLSITKEYVKCCYVDIDKNKAGDWRYEKIVAHTLSEPIPPDVMKIFKIRKEDE